MGARCRDSPAGPTTAKSGPGAVPAEAVLGRRQRSWCRRRTAPVVHQFRLIRARRPAVWMGEQVAAAVGKDWLDEVLADLEGIGYAGRAAVVPACAVDAPHRRDRLWIVTERSALWITASARDWKDSPGMTATRPDGRSRIDQLPRQVAAAMWQTPTSLSPARNGNSRAGNSAGLVAIRAHALAAMWPSPVALDTMARTGIRSRAARRLAGRPGTCRRQ